MFSHNLHGTRRCGANHLARPSAVALSACLLLCGLAAECATATTSDDGDIRRAKRGARWSGAVNAYFQSHKDEAERSAWVDYVKAFESFDVERFIDRPEIWSLARAGWRGKSAIASEYVRDMERPIDLLRKGAAKPQGEHPPWSGLDDDPLASPPVPISRARALVSALVLDGRSKAAEGDPLGAWASYRDALTFSSRLGRKGGILVEGTDPTNKHVAVAQLVPGRPRHGERG